MFFYDGGGLGLMDLFVSLLVDGHAFARRLWKANV